MEIVRRHQRTAIAGHGARYRLRPGQHRHRGAGRPGLGAFGHRPARRADRRRPRRPGYPAGRPRLDRARAGAARDPGPAERRGLRPVRGHRRAQGRHPARPEPRTCSARSAQAHHRAGGGQRRRVEPGRPAGDRLPASRRASRARSSAPRSTRARSPWKKPSRRWRSGDRGRAGHSLPGRGRRPGGQGRQLPRAARRRRPGRAGRVSTTPRARTSSTFLDITASSGGRETMLRRGAAHRRAGLHPAHRRRRRAQRWRTSTGCCGPGPTRSSLNTAAVARPDLLAETAGRFGRKCMVLSVDARRARGPAQRFRGDHARRPARHRDRRGRLGPAGHRARGGEILLNSMDARRHHDRLRPGADRGRCAPWRPSR